MSGADHPVAVCDRDLFALQATCLTCQRLAYWRIGAGRWGHADDAAD